MDEIIDSEMEQREQMEMIECLGRANVKIIELEAKLEIVKAQRNDLIKAACRLHSMSEYRIDTVIKLADKDAELF